MRAGKKGEFSLCERIFVNQLGLDGNNFTTIRKSALTFMADLMGPT
jgi:hypothetical protein